MKSLHSFFNFEDNVRHRQLTTITFRITIKVPVDMYLSTHVYKENEWLFIIAVIYAVYETFAGECDEQQNPDVKELYAN